MKLTLEDKARIEQEAEVYGTDSLAIALAFKEGAEYEHNYQREQWKEWRAEAEAKMIEYGKFVSDVEAERSEVIEKVTRLKSAVLPDEFGSTYYDLALNKVLEILNNYPDENAKRSL